MACPALGGPAQTQNPLGEKRKTDLTLTGLLMEGLAHACCNKVGGLLRFSLQEHMWGPNGCYHNVRSNPENSLMTRC